MRWVKHMTATAQDEKIARLIADYGHAGYGLWWLVVEAVAARLEGDGQPSVTYPVTKWSHLLSLRGSHVRQALLKLEVNHLVTIDWTEADITVTIPNLLKYRDEYTRKSGVAPDSVRSKKQIQRQNTETDTDQRERADAADAAVLFDVSPINARNAQPGRSKGKRSTEDIRAALGSRLSWWSQFWAIYPCRDGMNPAMDAFERRVTTLEIFGKVLAGAKSYAARYAADPNMRLKYAQGWINDERWTDRGADIRAPSLESTAICTVSDEVRRRLKEAQL